MSSRTSIDMFWDGPDLAARDVVYILFAGEKFKDDALEVTTENLELERNDTEVGADILVVSLETLARMKLVVWRGKDRIHLAI